MDLSPGRVTRPSARAEGAIVAWSPAARMLRTITFAFSDSSGLVSRHTAMLSRGGTIRLQIPSNYELLDFIQIVCDRVALMASLDEDSIHWIGVAVRESVINAIKHGNREHPGKLVTVEFAFTPPDSPTQLVVRVVDEGEGFDPDMVGNP